jgi:ribonucleoside-diphosphate reductase alpha chain
MCNLTEVNVSDVENQEDLNNRVSAAAVIGTLQASYTNFHYLRHEWKETTEKEGLLGVSMTGIASGAVYNLDMNQAADIVRSENARVAAAIGINEAARTTCVKPAGTTSLVLGTSSGVHAWHDKYYVRRMRIGKNEPIYNYLKEQVPDMIEDCRFKPHIESVLSIPQRAPDHAITRDEDVMDFLERVKRINMEWIAPGHNYGDNKHNVSCTVSVKADEWDKVGHWLWDNRDTYTGISVLPHDGGTYVQAPFETITEEQFNEMINKLHSIDLTKVIEDDPNINHVAESIACAGGACTI